MKAEAEGDDPGDHDVVGDFQRTADTLRAAPTPMMQPVMVCVVETGMPSSVAANNVMARRSRRKP